MKKRLFQILDEMNVLDDKNKTRNVSVSYGFLSATKVKQGTKVTMGADHQSLHDLMNEDVIPILILVNKKEYSKHEKK